MIVEKAKLLHINWKKHTAEVSINNQIYTVPLAFAGPLEWNDETTKNMFDVLLIGPTFQESIGILVYKQYVSEETKKKKWWWPFGGD